MLGHKSNMPLKKASIIILIPSLKKTPTLPRSARWICITPKGQKNFATIVWFHGGGITGGTKEIQKSFDG